MPTPITCSHTPHEPLTQVREAFRALSTRPVPLTLKVADLADGLPDEPLDPQALKALLLSPALDHPARGAIWARLLERTAEPEPEGEDWRLAVCGLAYPGLSRVFARWARLIDRTDREELQQVVLTGFWGGVTSGRGEAAWLSDPGRIPARLMWAAERAARAWYRERAGRNETQLPEEYLAAPAPAGVAPEDVLALAVRAGLIGQAGADLIVRTRLEGVSTAQIAAEQGTTAEAIAMRRMRAERRLTGAIRSGRLSLDTVESSCGR